MNKVNTENQIDKKQIAINASGQKLGRLASKIAVLLQGKDLADYAPNKVMPVEVVVNNISELDIPENKLANKQYQSFSGYPGGLKHQNMQQVIDNKGIAEILRRAVKGMLPKNKLQKLRMQNLIIESDK
jgi:large subunit ribosomal protein L13